MRCLPVSAVAPNRATGSPTAGRRGRVVRRPASTAPTRPRRRRTFLRPPQAVERPRHPLRKARQPLPRCRRHQPPLGRHTSGTPAAAADDAAYPGCTGTRPPRRLRLRAVDRIDLVVPPGGVADGVPPRADPSAGALGSSREGTHSRTLVPVVLTGITLGGVRRGVRSDRAFQAGGQDRVIARSLITRDVGGNRLPIPDRAAVHHLPVAQRWVEGMRGLGSVGASPNSPGYRGALTDRHTDAQRHRPVRPFGTAANYPPNPPSVHGANDARRPDCFRHRRGRRATARRARPGSGCLRAAAQGGWRGHPDETTTGPVGRRQGSRV